MAPEVDVFGISPAVMVGEYCCHLNLECGSGLREEVMQSGL